MALGGNFGTQLPPNPRTINCFLYNVQKCYCYHHLYWCCIIFPDIMIHEHLTTSSTEFNIYNQKVEFHLIVKFRTSSESSFEQPFSMFLIPSGIIYRKLHLINWTFLFRVKIVQLWLGHSVFECTNSASKEIFSLIFLLKGK